MIEKIKRVSQVTSVSLDANGMDTGRKGNSSGNSVFQHLLDKAMRGSGSIPVSETYVLDVGRATHSLFYAGKIKLDNLELMTR